MPRSAGRIATPAACMIRSISASGSMTASSSRRISGQRCGQPTVEPLGAVGGRRACGGPPPGSSRRSGRSAARTRRVERPAAPAPGLSAPPAARACSRAMLQVAIPTCSPCRVPGCGSREHVEKWLIACSPIEPQWLVPVTSTPRPERISSRVSRCMAARSPLEQPVRLGVEPRLVLGHQAVGRLGVDRVQQQVREQPVDLRRGAADRVAEPGPDHARRGGRQHREVEEHAGRAPGPAG